MDRISTLEVAIRNEQAEAAFYQREAQRSRNRAARSLFELLAQQEMQHVSLLADLSERLTRQGAWPEQIDSAETTAGVAEVLEQLQQPDGSDADRDLDQLGALRKAIEFERRAEAFYIELAEQGGPGPEQAFFRAMAGVERDHRAWIESFLAAIGGDAGP